MKGVANEQTTRRKKEVQTGFTLSTLSSQLPMSLALPLASRPVPAVVSKRGVASENAAERLLGDTAVASRTNNETQTAAQRVRRGIPQARAMPGESTNNQGRATTKASPDRQIRSPGTGAASNHDRSRSGAGCSPSGCTHGGAHHSRSSRRLTQAAPNVPASPAPWPPPLAAPATTQSPGARRRV